MSFRVVGASCAMLIAAGTLHAAEVVRGPYLQLGTPDGVVVRWRTDVATDSRVSFGATVGNLDSTVTSTPSTTEHVVQLSGLEASTRYYYEVGTSTETLAGGDGEHFFETPPLAGTVQATRVWVLGDSGTADIGAEIVRDAYYAYTAGQHTDLWIMLGDNAYPDGTDSDYQAAVFDMYPEMLRKSVLWPSLGNHDANSSGSATQSGPYFEMFTLPTNAEAGGVASGTEAYYSFDHANIHFVVLDSADSNLQIGSPMLDWLVADLADTDQDWIVAYWHHAPYSKGGHDTDNAQLEPRMVLMRENAVPVLEDYGVDLVLAGHSHNYERSFLIDSHYGTSDTFGPEHLVDGGDGRVDGDGAYVKPAAGGIPHWGAVYTVAGSSGVAQNGTFDHPAMYVAYKLNGSVVLDVDDDRLDATFLDWTGVEQDYFTILRDPSLVAHFEANPLAGGLPLAVDFTDLSLVQADAWAWDFEDDGVVDSTEQNPTHVYEQTGTYSVRLTITAEGQPFDKLRENYIAVSLEPPIANFSASPLLGKPPLAVDFVDLSAQAPDAWSWDFEDDGDADSPQANPTHVYDEPGFYSVELTVSNAAGSDALVRPSYVYVLADLPNEIEGLVLGPERPAISWDGHREVESYDLVKGSLNVLHASGGDFSVAQLGCVAEDHEFSGATDADAPSSGQGWFYLARGASDDVGSGTYDTAWPSQAAFRDAGLQGPGAVCDCAAGDDPDADGYCNAVDNCPAVFNPLQLDVDGDGTGDACETP